MKRKTFYVVTAVSAACSFAVSPRLGHLHPADADQASLFIKGWQPFLHFTAPLTSNAKLPFQSKEASIFESFEGQLTFDVRRKSQDQKDRYSTSVYLVSKSSETGIVQTSTEAAAADSAIASSTSTYITAPQFSSNGQLLMLALRQDFDVNNLIFTDVHEMGLQGLVATDGQEGIAPLAQGKVAWSDDNAHIAYFDPQTDDRGVYIDEFQLVSAERTVYVQDWHQKTRVIAAQAQGIVEPLSWQNDQLLFGALPFGSDRKAGIGKYDDYDASVNNKEYFLPRPNIYAYSLPDKKTRLLIEDGYRPSVSPDGKQIAFYGSSNPKEPVTLKRDENPAWLWRYISKGASLCFANSNGSGRTALQSYSGLYPRIQWLPDSRHFVTIYQTKRNPDYEAQLTLWDTETQSKKELGTIKVSDDEKQTENDAYAPLRFPFYPMGVTIDGKNIVIKTVSHHRKSDETIESLQLVSIETGESSTMATFKNVEGLDWTAQSITP